MSRRALPQDSAISVGKAAATAIAWQYKGEIRVTAIVKATFAFVPEGPMTRVEPQPIRVDDVTFGKQSTLQSIRFASDLVPYRRRADVLFTGYAHAPAGQSVETMRARLGLFTGGRALLDKTLLIRKKGGFVRLPLDYEHAFGGSGCAENPFGEGFSEDDDTESLNVFDPADARRVAGFAPIARTQDPRRRLRGSLPLPAFGAELVQIPDDFQFDFFQVAPENQRVEFLRGDEWIILDGMHPTAPMMRSRLPGARGIARIHGLGELGIAEGKPLAMSADTLHISGDEERCTVTWRGSFPVAHGAALGAARIVAGVELDGEPLVWPTAAELVVLAAQARAAAALPSAPAQPASDRTVSLGGANETMVALPAGWRPEKANAPATLPFQPPAGPSPAARPTPSRRASSGSDGATLPIPSGGSAAPVSLPFRGLDAAPPAESPAVVAPEPPPVVVTPEPPKVEAPPATAVIKAPESPWAPAPPPIEAPRAPKVEKRLPPKVDVGSKLYGARKKTP